MTAMKDCGIIVKASPYGVRETMDKLQYAIESNGATIYARIDQQAELKKTGLNIPPLTFILFGNPAAGGRLMQDNPMVALDLPLKIIAWEDAQQKVWLAYNDASYLRTRHDIDPAASVFLDLNKPVHKVLDTVQ